MMEYALFFVGRKYEKHFKLYSKICKTFSSELALIFRDSYGNLYEQPFFLQQENLYEPRSITHKEYNIYTKPDTAIECFKNPWLW